MGPAQWESVYLDICSDLGMDPASDGVQQRVLEACTLCSDLDDEDCIVPLMGPVATVFGAQARLEDDIRRFGARGTLIAAGSACGRVMDAGIRPDILVTDLDGPIGPQLEASRSGTVTLILAHGDNTDLVRRYAWAFRGKVVLTTQYGARGNILCFGGFTDGDRQVCLADAFGARDIRLLGFDFRNPFPKEGSDPVFKRKKLIWAERIISMIPQARIPDRRSHVHRDIFSGPVGPGHEPANGQRWEEGPDHRPHRALSWCRRPVRSPGTRSCRMWAPGPPSPIAVAPAGGSDRSAVAMRPL